MAVIEDVRQEEPTPTIGTLEQKIEQLTKSVDELRKLHNTYASKRKAVKNMIREIRQLALDLNVDEKELRMMISRSFDMAGISKSWQRKLLPESLKFTKHTRKDYLERQQQLDQQPLMKPPQQLQPSDGKATEVTGFGNKLPEMPQQEQKEKEELRQRIEELQRENRYLRRTTAIHAQQQQGEETFTGIGNLELGKFHMRLKVTVNVRTKSIEFIDIAW
jgi:TolA-binding protein